MTSRFKRRGILGIIAGGSFGGCLRMGQSNEEINADSAEFQFEYRSQNEELVITYSAGPSIDAGRIMLRDSNETSAKWTELGSTSKTEGDTISNGDSARIGANILNWDKPVKPSTTIWIVFTREGQPTTLARYTRDQEQSTAESEETPSDTEESNQTTEDSEGSAKVLYDYESGDLRDDWSVEMGTRGNHTFTTESHLVAQGDRSGNLKATSQNQERKLTFDQISPDVIQFYIAVVNVSGDLNGYHWRIRSGGQGVMSVKVSGFQQGGDTLGVNGEPEIDSTPTNELLRIEFVNIDFVNNVCDFKITRHSDGTVLSEGEDKEFLNEADHINNFYIRNDDTDESDSTSHITDYIHVS